MSKQDETKQVLVIRRDLQMRRGKEGTQLCHACIAFIRDRIKKAYADETPCSFRRCDICEILQLTPEQLEWILGDLTKKVVLQAKDEAELLEVDKLCREAKLEVFLIKDAGLTATGEGMQGVPTWTALGIGPNKFEDIDRITGPAGIHPLKLY